MDEVKSSDQTGALSVGPSLDSEQKQSEDPLGKAEKTSAAAAMKDTEDDKTVDQTGEPGASSTIGPTLDSDQERPKDPPGKDETINAAATMKDTEQPNSATKVGVDDKTLDRTGEPGAPLIDSSQDSEQEQPKDPPGKAETISPAATKKEMEQPSSAEQDNKARTKGADQSQAQNGDGSNLGGSTGVNLKSTLATADSETGSQASLAETAKMMSENLVPQLQNAIHTLHDSQKNLQELLGQVSKLLKVDTNTSPQAAPPPIKDKMLPSLLFKFCLPLLLAVLACSVAWYSEKEKLGTFDLENFFMLNPETASQWEQLDRKAIRILVTGKTGTGKSALINGLIGRNVTKEGDTLDPTTARVEQIKQMVHGISMSVFDSPGLQDGTLREQEYLQDMQQKCEKVDLVLYAIKMTDQRVHAADTKAMKKITDAFGHKLWEKAIFVMTFANEVRSPEYPDDEHENKEYFEKRLQDWIDKLPNIIEQRGDIPLNIGKHVPIIPAGYYKIRDLPGRKFWFSQFWKAALNRMMESSAEGASYMLQFSQDRLKHYNDMTEEDFQKPIHEQPILSNIVDE